jgi:SAM-dependent methyltransferase
MLQDRYTGSTPTAEPYAVTAEFYDILQAESDGRLAEQRFAAAAHAARVGIVDVGAGTGIVTQVLLNRSAAPVHVVEPSSAMRVALLTRLAALHADQRARVTVHPQAFQDVGLERVADLVVCANIAGVVEPPQRRALWRAAAAALVPGGVLLLDPPPPALPAAPLVKDLPPVRIGPDAYSAQVCMRPDRGLISVTCTYWVKRDEEIIRTEIEEFTMWPTSVAALHEELRQAGLSASTTAHGLIRATPAPAPGSR